MADSVALSNTAKRKRSPSAPSAAPASKSLKTATSNGNQLQINYLARQCADDLPFITKDDTLPNLLEILSSYTNVLDRQESLASNLGARPLGPILIKRFERCFDGPPKIIASHSHAKGSSNGEEEGAPTVTWLDVVHFAQAHPSQFDLATFSEGRRVCQFYYPQKQVRVQVSEEDFLFINSGRCQDLIPPLPIWEDEEKEVGTCEILEKALREITNAADMVAARTRQLGHRLKGRRMAIQERRSEQGHAQAELERTSQTPPTVSARPSFVSTNSQAATPVAVRPASTLDKADPSAAIRTDLLKHFQSLPHNQPATKPEPRRPSLVQPLSPANLPTQYQTPQANINTAPPEIAQSPSTSVSPVPTAPPNGHALDPLSYYIENHPSSYRSSFTPANLPAVDNAPKHNFSRPLPPSQESTQPYRGICQTHMESLPKGSRILPPCDRCRRLRMDCLKNLSSCAGCTKKHARCHWKDVRREEVLGLEGFEEAELAEQNIEQANTEGMLMDANNSGRHSEDDATRRVSEERLDPSGGMSTMNLPPLRRSELEQHAQASINHTQAEQAEQAAQAEQSQVLHQHTAPPNHQIYENHETENKNGLSSSIPPNPFTKRTDGDDNHHAMDLLRLLSREAPSNGSGSVTAASPGARNNGAFRSVYNPHLGEAGPNDSPTTTSTNGATFGIGVGVAGGDRLP